MKCIDPWLTKNRRVCPVCKGKVVLPGVTDPTDSESEGENAAVTERTPLVRNPHPSRWRRIRSARPLTVTTITAPAPQQAADPSPSPENQEVGSSTSDNNFPVSSGHFSVNCDEREGGGDGRESSSSATIAVVQVEPVHTPVTTSSSSRRSSRRSRRPDAIV